VAGQEDLAFEWDSGNVSHLARHRIQPGEIEEFFRGNPEVREHEVVEGEDRWTAVGVTRSLRVLVVIFSARNGRIRAITGWEADKRTAKQYFLRRAN
jgi:uncharacterized DUF497 family protein